MLWKTRKVRQLAKKHWTEGFYAGLLKGRNDTLLNYMDVPGWYDTIASAAHRAGYHEGRRVLQRSQSSRNPYAAMSEARRKPHEPSVDDMERFVRMAAGR